MKKLIKESKSGSVSEAVSGYRFGHVAVSVSVSTKQHSGYNDSGNDTSRKTTDCHTEAAVSAMFLCDIFLTLHILTCILMHKSWQIHHLTSVHPVVTCFCYDT